MVNDPVADFITRIRNGCMVKKKTVQANVSKLTTRLAEILREKGYIEDFRIEKDDGKLQMLVDLRYDSQGKSVVEGLKRVSRPGFRVYSGTEDLPNVRGDMGFAVISTSKGIMTSDEAKKLRVGGEVLCYVW